MCRLLCIRFDEGEQAPHQHSGTRPDDPPVALEAPARLHVRRGDTRLAGEQGPAVSLRVHGEVQGHLGEPGPVERRERARSHPLISEAFRPELPNEAEHDLGPGLLGEGHERGSGRCSRNWWGGRGSRAAQQAGQMQRDQAHRGQGPHQGVVGYERVQPLHSGIEIGRCRTHQGVLAHADIIGR